MDTGKEEVITPFGLSTPEDSPDRECSTSYVGSFLSKNIDNQISAKTT